jgi:hypothetical protein
VAALSAASSTQTGVATGLTNSVKAGARDRSCVFGIAVLNGVAGAEAGAAEATAGSLSGYMTVWIVYV